MDFSEVMLSALPALSRSKLETLLIEQRAARAAFVDASDREQAARQEAALAEANAQDRLAMFPGIPADEAAVRAEVQDGAHPGEAISAMRSGGSKGRWREAAADNREAIIRAPAESAKRRHAMALDARDRAATRQSAFAFLEEVETWLSRAAANGVSLRHHAPKPPSVRDPVAAISKLRAELLKVDDEWVDTEKAPAPASTLRAQAVAEIDEIARAGELNISEQSRTGRPLRLMERFDMNRAVVRGDGHVAMFRGIGGFDVVVALLRDQFIERAEALIAALPQDGALSDEQRERRFAEIAARRLEIERDEEALICAAVASGRQIDRRIDADPRAILEVIEI